MTTPPMEGQKGQILDGEAADGLFGSSVSLSADGTRVAVGAPFNDDGGRIRVFEFVNGDWTQVCADIDGESGNDEYGYAVALSDDGVCLAGGAPGNDNGGNSAGQVRAYTCPR